MAGAADHQRLMVDCLARTGGGRGSGDDPPRIHRPRRRRLAWGLPGCEPSGDAVRHSLSGTDLKVRPCHPVRRPRSSRDRPPTGCGGQWARGVGQLDGAESGDRGCASRSSLGDAAGWDVTGAEHLLVSATTALGAWAPPGRDGWDRRRRVGGAVARGRTTATTTSRCAGARMTSRCTTMRGGDWSETGTPTPRFKRCGGGAGRHRPRRTEASRGATDKEVDRPGSPRPSRMWGEGRAWGSRRGMPSCPTRSSDQLSVVRLGAAPGPPAPQAADVHSTAPRCAFASDPCGWTRSAPRHGRETWMWSGQDVCRCPHSAVLQRSKGCGRLDLASAWHLRTVLRVATSGRGPRERSTKRLLVCVRRTRKFPRIADLIARGRAGKFLRVAPPPGRKRSGTVCV